MSKDYYNILGVSKSASADELKRAYRKLAHEYHPDKASGSEAKFKEINEAYQVLSDPAKRQRYDQFGSADAPSGFGGYGGQAGYGNSQDYDFSGFGGFGGIGDIFESMFSQAFSHVQAEVEISLTQAMLGDKVQLKTSNNDTITLDIQPGTADGTTYRFRGKGNPTNRGRGDLTITVRIRLPHRLTREQREIFEQLRRSGL